MVVTLLIYHDHGSNVSKVFRAMKVVTHLSGLLFRYFLYENFNNKKLANSIVCYGQALKGSGFSISGRVG